MLSDYEDNPVVYLAYVGKYSNKYKIKWGFSKNFVRRDLDEHRKDFKIFNVIGIWKTLAYQTVEDKIKINFESKNIITPLKIEKNIKGKIINTTKKEIITLDEVNNLDYCLDMIETLVKKTKLPQEMEYDNKIKELTNKQELNEIIHENKLLILENKHLKEMNDQLKQNIKDLRKKN